MEELRSKLAELRNIVANESCVTTTTPSTRKLELSDIKALDEQVRPLQIKLATAIKDWEAEFKQIKRGPDGQPTQESLRLVHDKLHRRLQALRMYFGDTKSG